MTILTLLAALLLSGIAAYYSVIGLALIFSGAFWPVVFMGSSLEFAKLVTASWLYRNWKKAPILLKSYLTASVILLMLITSMGIFGFLAKSHIDSTLDAGVNSVEIKTLNAQEKIAKERLDYLLARAKDPSTASNKLDNQIQSTQKELAEINKKRLPLLKEENKLVADVGPIKYVADIFFEGDAALDKAVRLVIFLIMLVFDPLAVLLLIAANMSMPNVITKETIVSPVNTKEVDVYTEETQKQPLETVEVQKENLVEMKETEEMKPIEKPVEIHIEPGVYEEHHGATTK